MSNPSDIIQPRTRRRAGRDGNAPVTLAEQCTRILIRVPRIAASGSVQPQSTTVRQAPAPASDAPIQAASNAATITANATTTAPRLGSGIAAFDSPRLPQAATATRLDAPHSGVGPHLEAPAWLDNRSLRSANSMRQNILLVAAVVAGMVLGAVALHLRGHGSNLHGNGTSIHSATQASPEHSKPAANVADTAAVKFNEAAKISRESMPSDNASTGPLWKWKASTPANSPAVISEPAAMAPSETSSNAPAIVSPSGAEPGDPSRAAWLQGTISSPLESIQR